MIYSWSHGAVGFKKSIAFVSVDTTCVNGPLLQCGVDILYFQPDFVGVPFHHLKWFTFAGLFRLAYQLDRIFSSPSIS